VLQGIREVIDVLYGFAVDVCDNVLHLDSRAVRRTAGYHLRYAYPLAHARPPCTGVWTAETLGVSELPAPKRVPKSKTEVAADATPPTVITSAAEVANTFFTRLSLSNQIRAR
jgi:hypothetical protein